MRCRYRLLHVAPTSMSASLLSRVRLAQFMLLFMFIVYTLLMILAFC